MKINTQNRNIESSHDFEQTTFTISDNAQAFDILSSKLYTNIPLAIVRELSTNAYDSHVAAGNADIPFDVTAPTSFEPKFTIRDYGTGLSPEAMQTLYTRYFESTRNESNEFTGALGLGSKSPFSYTDMFSVTSYYNGTKYVYCAVKNEDGSPSLALLTQEETDEPNGLEISIDIKDQDAYAFRSAMEDVYFNFEVKPNVAGYVLPSCPTPRLSGDNWSLYEIGNVPSLFGWSDRIYVQMGNVAYKVDAGQLDSDSTPYLADGRILMSVPMGTCSISASREELHYDERTKKRLSAALKSVVADIMRKIADEGTEDETPFQRIGRLSSWNTLIDMPNIDTTVPTNTDDYELSQAYLHGGKLFIAGRSGAGQKARGSMSGRSIRPRMKTDYKFIENDVEGKLKPKHRAALRHLLSSTPEVCVFLVDRNDNPAAFEAFFGPLYAKVSDLRAPSRSDGSSSGERLKPTFVKELRVYGGEWSRVEDTSEIEEGALAVRRRGNKIIFLGREYTISEFDSTQRYLSPSYSIYGLPEGRFDKLCQDLGLRDIEKYAEEKVTSVVASFTETDHAAWQAYQSSNATNYSAFWTVIRRLNTDENNLLDHVTGLSDLAAKAYGQFDFNPAIMNYAFRTLVSKFSLDIPTAKSYISEFEDKYPLLSSIDDKWSWKAILNEVTLYINSKEDSNGTF